MSPASWIPWPNPFLFSPLDNSPSRFRSRNLLRSYSEDPPAGALSPAAAHARRQQQGHSSHTSLEAYADVAPSTAAAGLPMRPTDLGRLPHSTSLQALQDNSSAASLFQHYPTHSFPRQQHRRNPSWQHGRSRCLMPYASQFGLVFDY